MTPRDALLARGLRLEYTTLSWNVVGTIVVVAAAFAARSVALAGFGHRLLRPQGGPSGVARRHTAAHAHVTISVAVITVKVTLTGTGTHRKRVVQRVVLYHTRAQGTAGRHGRYAGHLRITYRSAKPVQATLTVTAQTAHGTATRTARVILKPQHP